MGTIFMVILRLRDEVVLPIVRVAGVQFHRSYGASLATALKHIRVIRALRIVLLLVSGAIRYARSA